MHTSLCVPDADWLSPVSPGVQHILCINAEQRGAHCKHACSNLELCLSCPNCNSCRGFNFPDFGSAGLLGDAGCGYRGCNCGQPGAHLCIVSNRLTGDAAPVLSGVFVADLGELLQVLAGTLNSWTLDAQAIRLSFFPRFRITHTSEKHPGQIYIAIINYVLMALTIVVVIAFRTSARIGLAYGLAVNMDLVLTTAFLTLVRRTTCELATLHET